MGPTGAEVRLPAALPDLHLQALVLPAAHVGESLPLRSRRGGGIQVDRKVEPPGDSRTELASKPDALGEGRVPERHEWDHIDRTDPRMLAGVLLHVDLVDGDGHRTLQGLHHRPGFARERQHTPVVAGIARPVEEVHAGRARHGGGELLDNVQPAALGEVGHGFNEAGHERYPDTSRAPVSRPALANDC